VRSSPSLLLWWACVCVHPPAGLVCDVLVVAQLGKSAGPSCRYPINPDPHQSHHRQPAHREPPTVPPQPQDSLAASQ
jgi:hypothetical protein